MKRGLLFALFVAGAAVACASASRKPNVLFITVDDLKPTLACYGDQTVIAPNIERIAQKGMVFESTYCQQAVCAPSRISAFTGQRPDSTKVWDLKTDMRTVRPDILTMPEYFKQNGYETVGRGKLMHGSKNNDPQSWSIPYLWYHQLEYAEGYGCPALGRHQNEACKKAYEEAVAQNMSWKDKAAHIRATGMATSTECLDVPDDAYVDGAVANDCMRLMEKMARADKPFFLAAGFSKPHLPFAVPKKYWDLYKRESFTLHPFQEHAKDSPEYAYSIMEELHNYTDIPAELKLKPDLQRKLIHGYYASVSYSDAQIGKLLDKLDELGIVDNTIIVLWGDHGWHFGDHGLWCKHSNFEQATRAPLIIAAPGYEGGRQSKSITEFIDMFPTICELAGLPVPDSAEGKSLVPVLKDPAVKVKDFAMSQYPAHEVDGLMGYSLRDDRYRLTVWVKDEVSKTGKFDPSVIDQVELYDYENDPLETTSQARNPEYKAVLDEMMVKMTGFFE